MDAIKFTLSGNTAFLKKPDVNSYYYFTYGCIHKVALLGILGAIAGYAGYNQMKEDDTYPEFYKKLKDTRIGIVQRNTKGYISKKVQVFNNSVGYASKEQGGNLIIKEQWLENPKWDIYLLIQNDVELEIARRLNSFEFKYIPYLGKNDHIANIDDVELIKDIKKINNATIINSIFNKSDFVLAKKDAFSGFDDDDEEPIWKYEEKLPVSLEEITNKYELDSFIATNSEVSEVCESVVYKINNKNIYFI